MAKAKKKEALTPEERLQAALVPDWEQPYKVPENWCWVRLGTVCRFENGYAFKSKDFSVNDGIPVVRISNITDSSISLEECVRTTENGIDEKYIIKNGDLLIAMSGATTGKNGIYYSDKIAYLNQRVGNIKVIDENILFSRFRNFYIANVEQEILNSAYGGAQPNISSNKICNMNFPLPPLPEQQRIVDRIESLFAKLDEAKQKAQDALDSFETRKAAILHKAFTGELTAQWRKEHGVGMESWENLTLNDIAEYKKGPFGSSITKSMFVPKGNNTYKVYEQGNAIRKTVEYGHYYISEQKYLELKSFSVSGGDIIISCAGTIGEVFKLPNNCERGIINQALMRVRIFSNIQEQFFIYYFGEILKGDVIDKANGTAIKNIPPFKIMKAMKIALPSVPEQTEIVRILDDLLAKEQEAKEAAEAVLEQIDLIKKSILARAFRGELGTNDPAEERAVELLKKILE